MKATHPLHGEVEVLSRLAGDIAVCRLANGVEMHLTASWLTELKKSLESAERTNTGLSGGAGKGNAGA